MKRMKTLASCCMAVACMAALFAFLTGCSSQQSYTPPEKTPTLASPVIGTDGTLRVGVDTEKAPLAGQPEGSTRIVGLDVDIAAALADSFGLKLEIVDVGKDPETALSEGRVDIVMGIDKSDTDTDTVFWKSEAYLPTAVALFSTSSNTEVPTSDSQPSIAAQVSSKSAWAVTNEFEGNIVTTELLDDAFSQLASGEVQYAAADALIGTYAAHKEGDDVQIVALMEQPSGYCIAVSDANADLKQAVSDALATLTSNGVIGVIETKWLGTTIDLSTTPLTAGATAAASGNADKKDDGDKPADDNATPADDNATPADDNADNATPADDNTTPADDDTGEPGDNAVQPEDIAV